MLWRGWYVVSNYNLYWQYVQRGRIMITMNMSDDASQMKVHNNEFLKKALYIILYLWAFAIIYGCPAMLLYITE